MDGFTMYFLPELSEVEIGQVLRNAGFDARGQGHGKVSISDGDAHVWIHVSRRHELEPPDIEEDGDWPIPRDRIGTLASLMVRRNSESVDLAVRVAHELVTKCGGMITWDGMDQWEDRYNAYLEN